MRWAWSWVVWLEFLGWNLDVRRVWSWSRVGVVGGLKGEVEGLIIGILVRVVNFERVWNRKRSVFLMTKYWCSWVGALAPHPWVMVSNSVRLQPIFLCSLVRPACFRFDFHVAGRFCVGVCFRSCMSSVQ